MAGQGSKSVAKPVQKAAYKVKVVKPGKRLAPKVQTNLDSFTVQGLQVIADNSGVDVDREVLILTDSAEWADVVDSDHLLIKPPRFTFQAGLSQVAGGSHDQSKSKSWSEVAGSQRDGMPWSDESFSSESVQHKAQVAPVHLAYHHVQSGGASISPPFSNCNCCGTGCRWNWLGCSTANEVWMVHIYVNLNRL